MNHRALATLETGIEQAPSQFIQLLDEHLGRVYAKLESTAAWRALLGADTPLEIVRAIMRELYLEVAWYQPDVIEATIAVIGQLPRTVSPKRIQTMLVHQANEFDHGEMAIRDYLALGGDESVVRKGRMSPTAHAVAAFWVMLAHKRDPFAYLGALYMFEGLTPRISGALLDRFKQVGFPTNAQAFAEFHATEDVKHQNLVRFLLESIAKEHPESVPAMLYGIHTFSHVFPIPVIEAGYERAICVRRKAN